VDITAKAGKYKNRETFISLVVDYLDHFGIDPAETYIKSDGTPAVELSFRFELDWGIRARMVRASSPIAYSEKPSRSPSQKTLLWPVMAYRCRLRMRQ
jgi:hypothetical protein